ncbi:hypothetical protein BDZ91DRAFT_151373 [Kalaharituber pfeilii]|nr:hypothetical protein BDZ91DRAFT_151373 [Kalaharituber pfeilii]
MLWCPALNNSVSIAVAYIKKRSPPLASNSFMSFILSKNALIFNLFYFTPVKISK